MSFYLSNRQFDKPPQGPHFFTHTDVWSEMIGKVKPENKNAKRVTEESSQLGGFRLLLKSECQEWGSRLAAPLRQDQGSISLNDNRDAPFTRWRLTYTRRAEDKRILDQS